MPSLLIAAALASGLATIAGDWRGVRRRWFYLTKPLTTLLILALAAITLTHAPRYQAWVMAALGFCLLGDVALMFAGTRAFVLGLSSFLLGHVLFIAAFVTDLPLVPLALPLVVWLLGGVFLAGVLSYARWLLPRTGRLKPAVLMYLTVLTAMTLAALLRAAVSESPAANWVCAGAMLFAVSDAVLAYRKFVRAPWWGQPVTLLTYYLAIGLMAWAY
ncbi:MAG: lysoplasmalogenase [Stagnimonas sp.]|nr:lysoplasmalogenase [Stagnimonas sp.]